MGVFGRCIAVASCAFSASWALSIQQQPLRVAPAEEYILESRLFAKSSGKFGATAPHRAERTAMTKEERQQALSDVQKFIQSSEEGFATLVLLGDSTMAGITEELLNMTSSSPGEAGCIYELLYVSNDRARSVNYGCNRGCGGVPPGGEWMDESKLTDDMARKTVWRAKESTRRLHAQGCKSGGGLETYVFRTGPFQGLVVHHWGFLPEYTEFCWDDCMTDAMAALKPQAVLWNIGLHLLNHDFKPSVCDVRKNPTKKNCGNYQDMVALATRGMESAGVDKVIWKTTNWLCEDIQSEGFPATKEALTKWHNVADRKKNNEQCLKDCPAYGSLDLPCYEWFMDAHTTTRLHQESAYALQKVRNEDGKGVHVLDAYWKTKYCCDQGCHDMTDDGEHYTGLDSKLMIGFASILGDRAIDA